MKSKNLLLGATCLLAAGFCCCKSPDIDSTMRITAPENIKGEILLPEKDYEFTINNIPFDSLSLSAALIRKDGSRFLLAAADRLPLRVTYRPDSIPDGAWKRKEADPAYIEGIIMARRYIKKNLRDSALYSFNIPFRPDRPEIEVLEDIVSKGLRKLSIGFKAPGAAACRLYYRAYGTEAEERIEQQGAEASKLSLPLLDEKKRYSIQVEAQNPHGITLSETLTIGSKRTKAALAVQRTSTDLKYQIRIGKDIVNGIVIYSAGIYDRLGKLKMQVPTTPDVFFSIESLEPGPYVIKVNVKDYGICSGVFIKR